jgi:enamine deaminase RidA (YjgF/YER057c/UK114 family)
LKPALEAADSSLEQSLKAQIYLSRIDDFPDFVDVWNRYYANIPCAVTLVPTKSFATVGGIIEINLLALTNTAARKKQVIAGHIPGMAAYGPCIWAGEFLLPSGLMAVGHDGSVVGKTLSPGFAALSHAGYTQAAAIYAYAEALCRNAGTSMANVLRAQYFVSDQTAFPAIAMAWSAKMGAQPHPFFAFRPRPPCRRRAPCSSPISGLPNPRVGHRHLFVVGAPRGSPRPTMLASSSASSSRLRRRRGLLPE